MKGTFVYGLEFMLTLDKVQNTFNVHKVRNLRPVHYESYSSFSYHMHSSVYRVFWPSSRVSELIQHVAVLD